MSHVIDATANDFESAVLGAKGPVLVDFWAPWCRPCQMMAPILDQLSIDMKDKLTVVKVDVEDPQNGGLAMQYQIRSIPNMKVFKGGSVVHDIVGLRPLEQLKQELEPFV